VCCYVRGEGGRFGLGRVGIGVEIGIWEEAGTGNGNGNDDTDWMGMIA
jgi:hypothetical protein